MPDLNAQPVGLGATDVPAAGAVPWRWVVVGVLAALAAVGLAQWWFAEPPPDAPAASGPVVNPPAAPTSMPAVPPPAAPSEAATRSAPPPPTQAAARPAPPPAAVAPPPSPAKPRPEPKPRPKPEPAPRAEARARPAPPPVTAPASEAAPVRLPKLAELPEELRRDVPALALGGTVYSPQPSARMLILNGQVFREGDTLAPGLVLERIQPKSAVFSMRGQRFELPF